MKKELKESYSREEVDFSNLISVIMKETSDTAQGDSIYWHSKNRILVEIDFENKCINYNVDAKSNMKNRRFYQISGACSTHNYEFIEVFW